MRREKIGCRYSIRLFASPPIIERSGYRNDQGVPWSNVQEGILMQIGRSITIHYDTHAHCDRAEPSHHVIEYAGINRHLFRGAFVSSPVSLFLRRRHEFLFRQLRPFITSLIRSTNPFVFRHASVAHATRTSPEFKGKKRTPLPFSADRGME